MIAGHKKRMTVEAIIGVTAYVAAAVVASGASPREPGLGMKIVPLLAVRSEERRVG